MMTAVGNTEEGKHQTYCRNSSWNHLVEMEALFREATDNNAGNVHLDRTVVGKQLGNVGFILELEGSYWVSAVRELHDQSVIFRR